MRPEVILTIAAVLLAVGVGCSTSVDFSKLEHSVANVFNGGQEGREKRLIPEGMLDPYSVLGFLSFTTFIFSILYNRYKIRGHHNPGGSNPQAAALNNIDHQQNFAYILNMASKILSNAAHLEDKPGSANVSLLDNIDYYDTSDTSDAMYLTSKTKTKPFSKLR